MSEYRDMVQRNRLEMEADVVDEYFNLSDEGGINKLDIIHLFGKEMLETIQEKLSKATGLGFVTVDFKGEPITEPTSFCRFCQEIRSDPIAIERCKSSDAFGSIQAAVTQKTNVYFCPCGLLEVAIPIIIRDHYLGGFIGGQIRCNDAPEEVSRLASVMYSAKADEIAAKNQEWFDSIPIYSYVKFMDIANLVFLVINQLSENEISQHIQADVLKKRIMKIQSANQRYLNENLQISRKLKEMEIRSNPYELLDMLSSLLNLSIIEEAKQTNEMLSLFIEYFKYKYTDKGTLIHIFSELENIERYLLYQQKKLGGRLDYSIQVPKDMHMQRMPSDILMPFVQNAVYNDIMLNKKGGKILITGFARNNNLVLDIFSSGPGLSEAEIKIRYETFKDHHEGYYIDLGMSNAKEKMKQLFGEGYDIVVKSQRNKGIRCVMVWPEHSEERIE